jgi:histidine triad (HIT) family protein
MTIFSKIIAGEIPCYKLAENEHFIAFLDIYPSKRGHTLVVPKIEVDKLFDVPDEYLTGLLTFAKPIAKAIEKAYPCNRVSILTLGLDVPHAHVHLIPMDKTSDMSPLISKLSLTKEELKEAQERILGYL